MTRKLYHSEVFWPKRVKNCLPFGTLNVVYSKHARRASQDDRYGTFNLPPQVNLDDCYIFEAEEKGKGNIVKFVFRHPMGDGRSLVMACVPERTEIGRVLFCKTVWINVDSDKHNTLKRENYVNG